MAQAFEMLGDPLTLGAALEQNAHRRAIAEDPREVGPRRVAPTLFHDRPVLTPDPKLTTPQMQIDGNILHGWLLLLSALFRQSDTPTCGAQATTSGGSQPLHLIFLVFVVLRDALRGGRRDACQRGH
jgi:hypothetical protein